MGFSFVARTFVVGFNCSFLLLTTLTRLRDLFSLLIAYCGRLLSSRIQSFPIITNCNSVLATWCITPERYTTSKPILKSLKRRRASDSNLPTKLRDHKKASWTIGFVCIFIEWSVSKEPKPYNGCTFALRRIALLFCFRQFSCSLTNWLVDSSDYLWRRAQPQKSLHEYISNVQWPLN